MARVGQERATGIELYDRGNSRVEERKKIMPRRWTARSTGGTAAEPSCNSADSTAASVCYTPSLRRKQLPTIEQIKTQLKKGEKRIGRRKTQLKKKKEKTQMSTSNISFNLH